MLAAQIPSKSYRNLNNKKQKTKKNFVINTLKSTTKKNKQKI